MTIWVFLASLATFLIGWIGGRMLEKVKRIEQRLGMNDGVIVNVSNAEFSNEKGFIKIKIPLKSFEGYKKSIQDDNTSTEYIIAKEGFIVKPKNL